MYGMQFACYMKYIGIISNMSIISFYLCLTWRICLHLLFAYVYVLMCWCYIGPILVLVPLCVHRAP